MPKKLTKLGRAKVPRSQGLILQHYEVCHLRGLPISGRTELKPC